jgi:hypothetical protein
MLTLGQYLQQTVDAAERKKQEDRVKEEQAATRRLAHKIEFCKDVWHTLSAQIVNGKYPEYRVDDDMLVMWMIGKGKLFSARGHVPESTIGRYIWRDCVDRFKREGVELVINKQHDGQGMESWHTINVVMPKPMV